MKRPDKYPIIDPRLPRLYDRILETARTMRAQKQAEAAISWAELRAKRLQELQAIGKREAVEEPAEA